MPVFANVHEVTRYIETSFEKLSVKEVDKATARAINRSILKGRTIARGAVKKVYNIPQNRLDGIKVARTATFNSLWGALGATAKPLPMDTFLKSFSFSSGSNTRFSKKGIGKTKLLKGSSKQYKQGVTIEVQRGKTEVIPWAFMLAGAKQRIFARGAYKAGGSWGFMRRHTRLANSSGNDSVKPLISVTIHAAVINPTASHLLYVEVVPFYSSRLITELEFQITKM